MPSELAVRIAERMDGTTFSTDNANEQVATIIDAELAEVRKALEALSCACKRLPISACPQCGGRLEAVTYPSDSMLNQDQFDSVRAGDWYCTNCKGVEARSGYKYWWDNDLGKSNQQCARCAALADLEVKSSKHKTESPKGTEGKHDSRR